MGLYGTEAEQRDARLLLQWATDPNTSEREANIYLRAAIGNGMENSATHPTPQGGEIELQDKDLQPVVELEQEATPAPTRPGFRR